ncbi:molybdopterin-dependent oxidoreductase [Sphingosinicellaceae bacterium]|nr:molybdopterin-dependent oxidoreductase [Sphingosinicellaceae bacterium]
MTVPAILSGGLSGGLSRRGLLKTGAAVGGGLLVAVSFPRGHADAAGTGTPGVFAPDAFIRIGRDGLVTLVMAQVEMGQGTHTSIPMLIAEELDVTLDHVRLEEAPPDDAKYGNPIFQIQMTGGSTSIRALWLPMRKAGASARALLVGAAAKGWGVDPTSCRTLAGVVYHDASGRKAEYGSLVDRASGMTPPANPLLKPASAFRLLGTPAKRLDTADKVNGKAVYGIDAMPISVKFASLACSPVLGGKVAHVDQTQALAVKGVRQVVVLDDMVAVVGDHMWAAKQGLDALVIEWAEGANAAVDSDGIWQALAAAGDKPGVTVKKTGDQAKLGGDGLIEARYELPFLAHAALEPMNCTVHVRPDGCELWVGTQVATNAVRIAAKETGLRVDQIKLNNHLIGGGFGRRLEVDGIGKAVRIAMKVDGPVKVVWTREEDIARSTYRPVYHNRMSARLENGKPVAWSQRIVGSAIIARFLPPAFKDGIDIDAVDGATELPYDLPNFHLDYVRHEPVGVDTCFWRGVGPNSNIFSAECFMDRLAKEAGADPVAFRRSLLGHSPRALGVLDLVTAKAGWGGALPARSGRGVCLQSAFGSFIACVAEVAVDEDGEVRVSRLTVAVDCGSIVNPDTIAAQLQGGMIFGLTAALHGNITLARGRVEQSNYHDYRMLRINETPRIEVHIIPSTEAPGGIGEPGTVVVQPAVANAVYAATGVQMTRMPIDRKLLKA